MKNITFLMISVLSFNFLIGQTPDQDYYTSVSSTTSFGNDMTDNNNGQSFTSGMTGNLTSIKVGIEASDPFDQCDIGDETVLVMEVHSGDGFSGSVLGTSYSVTIPSCSSLTEFTFPTPIAIVSGSMYTFEVNILSEDCSGLSSGLKAVFSGTYANGTAYNAGSPHPSADIMFQTFIDSTAPNPDPDQDYYTSVSSTTSFGNDMTDNNNGQSFTSGMTGNLTSIKVGIEASDPFDQCDIGDETVLVMEVHSGDGFSGSVLGTSYNVTIPSCSSLTEFTFPTPIAVVSGSMYTFEVNILSEDCSGLSSGLKAVFSGTYANGTAYNAGSPHPSADIMFQTFTESTLNVEENEIDGIIKIYPNPVQDLLYVVNVENLKSVKVYSSLGQLVIDTKNERINFSNLINGIYFIQINSERGIKIGKVIKK